MLIYLTYLKKRKKDEEADKLILEKIESLYKRVLGKENFNVQIQTLKSKDVAGMIILSEENRRMQDMMRQFSMSGMDSSMFPTNESLVLNKNHPLVQYTLENSDSENETTDLIAEQIYDLAMMSHKPLEADAMTAFIKRSNDIMARMIKS